jgi:hypothetical protein
MSKPSTKYNPQSMASALAFFVAMRQEDKNETLMELSDAQADGLVAAVSHMLDDRDPAPIAASFDARIDTMRGLEVEELFRELHKRLPPRLLAWAERGWNV